MKQTISGREDRHKQWKDKWERLGGEDGFFRGANRSQGRLKPSELLKRILQIVLATIKWAFIGLVAVELFCFGLISLTNYIIYGHLREGTRVLYDPYALFYREAGPRPTLNNSGPSETKDVTRIWMFGGSTMKGATEDDGKTIPSLTARILNSGENNRKVHISNFGMSSYNSLLEVQYFQKQMIENPHKPDLALFYDGANDSTYFNEFRTSAAHFGYRRVKAIIEAYHYQWFGLLKPVTAAVNSSFTKEVIDKFMAVTDRINKSDPELKRLVKEVVNRYDHTNKVCDQYGAAFMVVWQPMLWSENCEVDSGVKEKEKDFILNQEKFQTLKENFNTPYLAIRDAIKDKPYFFDLSRSLCHRKAPAYKPDGVHLTDSGRAIIAARISSIILAELWP